MDDLPTDYDAIIVGTGMTESVIAAALSRIGKSVLHLDSNEYYGENWASFNLESFEHLIETLNENNAENSEVVNDNFDEVLKENENLFNIQVQSSIWNATLYKHKEKLKSPQIESSVIEKEEVSKEIKEKIDDEKLIVESPQEDIQKLSRKFNLDLCPKLLFSKGKLVQLLISSNIARYAEFKSISRVLTWRNNQLEPVPCSRADVFATKNVSVVQKRILVKILTLFANYPQNSDEFEGFEKKKFLDYLKHKKLPDNLIHYILYAIAMGDNTTSCLDGIKACKAFLESLGRYGNTPFIFPMYGSGELPQCFCRLCAVFGGIYCLQRKIEHLIIQNNKCVGVISNGKRLNAKAIVLSSSYAPQIYLNDENPVHISRGIFITDRSILRSEKESLTLLQFPPVPDISKYSVTVIELGSGACTCPENFFVVHMTTKMTKEASTDLKHVIESLFHTEGKEFDEGNPKPRILWSVTWNVAQRTSQINEKCPENLKICCSVDCELDYDFCISEAERLFKELYPEEEFLPRAPDPNEIVLDAEEKVLEVEEEASEEPACDKTTENNQSENS